MLIWQDGKTQVVANDLGDRVTPAVVAFVDQEIVSKKKKIAISTQSNEMTPAKIIVLIQQEIKCIIS